MTWVYVYTSLLTAFIGCALYSLLSPGHHAEALKNLLGGISLLFATGQALAKVNFRFYLWTQRLWIKLNGSSQSLWRFGMRLDGEFSEDTLGDIQSFLMRDAKQWQPKVTRLNQRELLVKLDRTIHLRITRDSHLYSEDGLDHLLIQSDELDVTYKSARERIDRCILPLFNLFLTRMQPTQSSTFLDVEFNKRNPFFAFFVAHLRPDDITHFNLVFKPESLSRSSLDRVTVTKGALQILATTPEDFSQLSKAFLLLSSDAAHYVNA